MKRSTNTLRFGAIAIAAALLASCGGSKDEVTEATEAVEEVVTEVTEAGEELVDDVTDAGADAVEEVTEASSSSAKALVEKCVEEGEPEEVCNCQIGAIEEALGEDDFSKLVGFAMDDDEEGAEKLMTEILSDKPEVAMSMGMKMMGCTEG